MDDLADWPNCIVAGCPRKCCLALNSDKCFPHTAGNAHVKHWKIDARNAGRSDAPKAGTLPTRIITAEEA